MAIADWSSLWNGRKGGEVGNGRHPNIDVAPRDKVETYHSPGSMSGGKQTGRPRGVNDNRLRG